MSGGTRSRLSIRPCKFFIPQFVWLSRTFASGSCELGHLEDLFFSFVVDTSSQRLSCVSSLSVHCVFSSECRMTIRVGSRIIQKMSDQHNIAPTPVLLCQTSVRTAQPTLLLSLTNCFLERVSMGLFTGSASSSCAFSVAVTVPRIIALSAPRSARAVDCCSCCWRRSRTTMRLRRLCVAMSRVGLLWEVGQSSSLAPCMCMPRCVESLEALSEFKKTTSNLGKSVVS